MQVICTSLQTDNHANTSSLQFFTGRMPFLLPSQQCQSTEGRCVNIHNFKSNANSMIISHPPAPPLDPTRLFQVQSPSAACCTDSQSTLTSQPQVLTPGCNTNNDVKLTGNQSCTLHVGTITFEATERRQCTTADDILCCALCSLKTTFPVTLNGQLSSSGHTSVSDLK